MEASYRLRSLGMTNRVEELLEQARKLTPEEQAELFQAVHELIAPVDPQWETAWIEECEARLAEYERGGALAEDAAAVLGRLRARFVKR
jgi:hypothetical protein